MYKKQNGNSSDKELIDISSDDDISKNESKAGKETKELNVCNVTEESLHTPSITPKLETATEKPETSTSKPEPCVSKPEIHSSKPETPISKLETPVKSKTVCIFIYDFIIKILNCQVIKNNRVK